MSVIDDQARLRPHLLPGERLIWIGRPQQGLIVECSDLIFVPAMLGFGAFLLWLRLDDMLSDPVDAFAESLTLLGILHVAILRYFHEAWVRSRLLYAVTSQRALILRGRGAAVSQDLAWLPMLELELRDGRGTIFIEDPPEEKGWFSGAARRFKPFSSGFSFFRIERPQPVYDLIGRESRYRRTELNLDAPERLIA